MNNQECGWMERSLPHPDGDTEILACPTCGSGEYLHNEDGNRNRYCGQCGQIIDWPDDERGAGK